MGKSVPRSDGDYRKAVLESGYPLEIKAALSFLKAGFEVQPSFIIENPTTEKFAEIDLVATYRGEVAIGQSQVKTLLRIGVECKDNSLPFVCFGIPKPISPQRGEIDRDVTYCHINTTMDDSPNKFSLVMLDPSTRLGTKNRIHHFQGDERFHSAKAIVETQKGGLQVNEDSKLHDALVKMGAFFWSFHTEWPRQKPRFIVEESAGDPVISIAFGMLLHSGKHFRWDYQREFFTESQHTPIFLSTGFRGERLFYVLDFVRFEYLPTALKSVRESFDAMLTQIRPCFEQALRSGIRIQRGEKTF